MSINENDDINISVNFTGHADDEVRLVQQALGINPGLQVDVQVNGDDVVFNVDAYGIGGIDYKEFLETIIETLQTVVNRFEEAVYDDDEPAEG